jgi:small-conductance mechanosensitive channel
MWENLLFVAVEISLIIGVGITLTWLTSLVRKYSHKIPYLHSKEKIITRLLLRSQKILLFGTIALVLAVLGLNGWLIWQQKNIREFTLNLLKQIPQDFWISTSLALGKTIILLNLTYWIIPYINRGLNQLNYRLKKYDNIKANDYSIAQFFSFLKTHLNNIIWLSSFTCCTIFLQLPEIFPKYLFISIKIYGIIAAGFLTVKATTAIIDSLDGIRNKYANSNHITIKIYDRFSHLIPLLKRCLEYQLYVAITSFVIQQVDFISALSKYGPKGVAIIGIIFLAAVVDEVAKVILEELMLKNDNLNNLQQQRRQTIIPLIKSLLKYLIYFAACVAMLQTIGVDPGPILAGAGIVGIALGIGAQNVVNDIVCGFFILFENYYLVGDYIKAGEAEGIVQSIDLRTTRILHPTGKQYIVRNGEVKDLINFSKEFLLVTVEFLSPDHVNLDRIKKILENVCQQLGELHPNMLLDEPEIIISENIGYPDILVTVSTKVKPGNDQIIQRDLSKMVKQTFREEGIRIFSPHRKVLYRKPKSLAKSQG